MSTSQTTCLYGKGYIGLGSGLGVIGCDTRIDVI
mgnify:CR=1 FL=1